MLNTVKELEDDVVLASHMQIYNMDDRRTLDDGIGIGFIDPEGWRNMLENILNEFMHIYHT